MSNTKVVGWFIRDSANNYSVDTNLLPYLSKPADLTTVNFDLSVVHGDCRPVNKDAEGTSLEEICRWIVENKKDGNRALSNYNLDPAVFSSIDVVCTRSALKNLLLLKFGKKKISIQACKVGGVIFLSDKEGKNKDEKKYKELKDGDSNKDKKKDEKKLKELQDGDSKDKKKDGKDEKQKEGASKENKKDKEGKDKKDGTKTSKEGDKDVVKEKDKDKKKDKKEKCKDERTLDAKLKHYLLSDTKGGAPSPGTVNKCNSLSYVFLTELPADGDTAAIKVLHSGTMDTVSGEVETLDENSNVFIKTTNGEPDEKVLLRWWAQCVISKTRVVIVGFRDKDGHVRSLREMTLEQIETKIKEGRTDWSGEQSVQRAKAVLDEVKRSLTQDNEAKSFSYKLDTSHAQGFVLKIESNPAVKDRLLPTWYTTGGELK